MRNPLPVIGCRFHLEILHQSVGATLMVLNEDDRQRASVHVADCKKETVSHPSAEEI